MLILGIDIGGTTTKIVGLQNGIMLDPMMVTATDPITSLYGAFGKYLSVNSISLEQIDDIRITGVGSSHVEGNIFGIPTHVVEEFTSFGLGGLRLSGKERAIVVSMGTGTAFVKADINGIKHLGGSGVGGGTLTGLSSRLLHINNFSSICSLAEEGNLDNIDLSVGDISKTGQSMLKNKTTASNFGKISDYATKNDIAYGLVNMIIQTIGMLSVFAARSENLTDVVLCGYISTLPKTNEILDDISDMHHINFVFPQHPEYATALGAAMIGEADAGK